MAKIKELIEEFYKTFEKTTLRATFLSEGHDLLDHEDHLFVTDCNIDMICDELLRLSWYPGRKFEPDDIVAQTNENRESYLLSQMDEFDQFVQVQKEEFDKLPQMKSGDYYEENEEIHKQRRAFLPMLHERFPRMILKFNDNEFYRSAELIEYEQALESISNILSLSDKKEQIAGLKDYISRYSTHELVGVETKKEYKKRIAEENRLKLEEEANEIAVQYRCNVSSMKFIAALHRELILYRDRKEGLKEDGLCATAYPGSIRGFDQWNEINDDLRGRVSRIYEIINWLKSECPLLWAKYQERQLRKKGKK